jgi:hypothetical protein
MLLDVLSKRLKRETTWTAGVSSSLGRGPGGIIISETDTHTHKGVCLFAREKKISGSRLFRVRVVIGSNEMVAW